MVDQIARVAPASGLRFTVGRIDGSLYGRARLHDVTVSDPKGAFMTVPLVARAMWPGLISPMSACAQVTDC